MVDENYTSLICAARFLLVEKGLIRIKTNHKN